MCNKEALFLSIGDLTQGEIKGLSDIRIPFFLVVGEHSKDSPPSFTLADSDEEETEEEDDEEHTFLGFDDGMTLLIAHNVIKLIRENPSLKGLISAEDYDYDMLLRETKSLKNINTDVIASEFSSLGQDPDEFTFKRQSQDTKVVYEFKKLVHDLIEKALTDELGFGRALTKLASYIGHVYEIGYKYQSAYLNRIGLTLEEYQDAIKILLDKGLVENYGWGLICPNCVREQTVSFGTESSFSPSDMDLNCPECNTKMDWCLLVRLTDSLRDAIWYKDGLLALAIGWYLSKEGLSYRSNIPIADGECDLLIRVSGFQCGVELKMFQRSTDIKNERDFKKAIVQITRARKELGEFRPLIVHNSDNTPMLSCLGSSDSIEINIMHYLEIERLFYENHR